MKTISRRLGGDRRLAMRAGLGIALTGLLLGGAAFSAQAVQGAPGVEGHAAEEDTETLVDLRAADPLREAVSDELSVRIPLLVEPGNPDSPERTDVTPLEIAVSADGKFAYSSRNGLRTHDIFIFDLEKSMHVETREAPIDSYSGGQLRAAKHADVLAYIDGSPAGVYEVIVLDTKTNAEIARHTLPGSYGHRVEISDDGKSFFMLDYASKISTLRKIDLRTGEITEGPEFPYLPNGALAISPDGSTIAVGLGGDNANGNLTLVDTETLQTTAGPYTNDKIWQFEQMTFDSAGTSLYTTAYTRTVAKLSQGDGQNLSRITVGNGLASLLPVPDRDRAWAASSREDLVVVADFEKGVRSASYREVLGGPYAMQQTVNGDLVVSNGGGNTPESSISVLLAPEVTSQPVDAEISTLGESVQFEASLNGVKADLDSGVTWQSSADGETWNDLEEHTTTLQLTADAEAVALQYRMSYTDEFWGQTGATDVVRIVGVQPVITSAPLEVKAKVGESLDPVTVTATAQPGYVWSVEGLPAGLSVDAETGVLSGTATEAGTFTFTVKVTDVFGSASQEGTITVVAEDSDGDGDSDAGETDSDAGETDADADTDAGETDSDAGETDGDSDAGETDADTDTDAGETDADSDAGETDADSDAGETDADTDAGDTDTDTDAGDTDAGDTDAGTDTDAGDTDNATDANVDAGGDSDAATNGDSDSSGSDSGSDTDSGAASDTDSNTDADGNGDGGKDPLPNTGSEGMVMVAIAAVIALGAGVAVVIARRRSMTEN
ncbi:putative Ig domain-containing protein [Leucobacter chinensis]|uniref:putative Ig domain-containing protein n=1 Tax=Leucobacter chinensis TaxID=2851010 RepID=UPI001C20F70C